MAKILIVEDDPLMARLYQKIFHFEKHEVVLAADGMEGIEKTREEKPALILLDIMMPKMNGLEVLEKLKKDPETKKIPVVVLTNLAGEKDAESAMLKGAVKYIVKSQFDPKEVTKMVNQILLAHTRDAPPGAD